MPDISEEDALNVKKAFGGLSEEEEAKVRRNEIAKKLSESGRGLGQKGLLAMGGYGKK
jgi:hypothetical protein